MFTVKFLVFLKINLFTSMPNFKLYIDSEIPERADERQPLFVFFLIFKYIN